VCLCYDGLLPNRVCAGPAAELRWAPSRALCRRWPDWPLLKPPGLYGRENPRPAFCRAGASRSQISRVVTTYTATSCEGT
jgi:hypothetical protein